MAKQNAANTAATLHLTVTFDLRLQEVLDAARDIVERAREQGTLEGFLEIHRADNIDVGEL